MTPFCQQIAKQMMTIPDKLCLVDQLGNQLTYADVDRLTGQVVTYLRSKGVGRGDFVFINLPRGAMVYVAALGIIRNICGPSSCTAASLQRTTTLFHPT